MERRRIPTAHPSPTVEIRQHRPGDMGWVLERHGTLYAQEYGWGQPFETLVAQVVADFLRTSASDDHERCWVAELDGERVGSVMLVRHPDRPGVAKLRLLLVEPSARGLGIGQRLVRECVDFAWRCGYSTVTLWTNDVLTSARRIYEAAGFTLVDEKPNLSFGVGLREQVWELHRPQET